MKPRKTKLQYKTVEHHALLVLATVVAAVVVELATTASEADEDAGIGSSVRDAAVLAPGERNTHHTHAHTKIHST